MILSLATARILEIRWKHNEDHWDIGRMDLIAGSHIYSNVDAWRGVNLQNKNRVRKRDVELLLHENISTNESDKNDNGKTGNEFDDSSRSKDGSMVVEAE